MLDRLCEAALPGKSQCFQRSAARAGGISIRHDVDGNVCLLHALGRHAHADLCQKPLLKFLTGFENATTYDQGIGVKGIHHLIEEKSKGVGLNPENLFAHGIPLIREAAHVFSRLMWFLLC